MKCVLKRLKLNGNKTELLIIRSRNVLSPVRENMEISNSTIQPSTLAHNMGVTFDEYMSMNKHIANVDCTQKLFFPFKKNSKNKGLSIIASTRVKLELGKRTLL